MNFREFTAKDYRLIESQWQGLLEAAQKRCGSDDELKTIQRAFELANFAHKNHRRMSGDPHIIHPLSVARIVMEEMGLGYKSTTAALLHDIVEYTDFTADDIRNLFGEKIAQLVDGLYKTKVVLDEDARKSKSAFSSQDIQAENFKRILLSLGNDPRVVLIKLADRLHNCRTIEVLPDIKRDRVLAETMYIFIPLAHRLGFYSIKSEMENIWLKYRQPAEYREISRKINKNAAQRENDIDEFIAPIREALDSKGISYRLKKRVKSPYSIWYKMLNKNVKFDEIYDLYAVRIIYEPDAIEHENSEAFAIRNIISSMYESNPDRERNWIIDPKPNGYQSLHETYLSKSGVWVEVQIRSRRMDDIAEKGIAAHWTYKSHGYQSEINTEMDRWLVKIQDILASGDFDAFELLDIRRDELGNKEITVFTPKGEQRSVPVGCTALDFAYSIHTQIGNKTIACKINSVLMPPSAVLKAGDNVEIITAEKATPRIEWLEFLRTRNAKNKVMAYFRTNRPAEFKQIRTALTDVRQDDRKDFMVKLAIKGDDKPGMLNELTRCISLAMELNMRQIHLGCEGKIFDGIIELEVHDSSVLDELIDKMKKIDGIRDVVRTDIMA